MAMAGRIERIISEKISQSLKPIHLNIINESHMHSVPRGSETHFRLVVVSEAFENQSKLSQHRLIHGILKEELASGVHALSLQTFTKTQWEKFITPPPVESSPPCLGGMKKENKQSNPEGFYSESPQRLE